ncbi:MAG: S41 family peptidase, partial [Candidatus Brocadiales bacterium]
GTKVTLYLLTGKSAEPKLVTLKREIIALPSVESQLLAENIAYIKIRNFQEDTVDDLDKNLQQLQKTPQGLRGVSLDMRNNSGGLLDQAVGVSDRFLDKGVIVATVGQGKRQREVQKARYSERDVVLCPMIVIIDAGSASGSEIVAAALKENDRALLVGDRSFGKGTVQQLIDLADGSALKLTVAKYLTPLYRDIQTLGITPDVNLIPVVLGKENILLERGTTGVLREADMRGHLHGEITPPDPPLVSLKYLATYDET